MWGRKFEHSLDGTTVGAIARWQSKQALATMQQSLEFQNLVKILDGEIIHAAPHIYEEVALINNAESKLFLNNSLTRN